MALEALLPFALLPLRIVIGIIFLVHGWPKLMKMGETTGFVKSLGFPLPAVFAFLLAATEALGGVAMIVGAAVQIVTVLQIIVMLVAFYQKRFVWKKPFNGGYELDLLLIAGLLALHLLGAGPYSVDAMFGLSFF